MYLECKYLASGDSGIVVEVGNDISKEINTKIRALLYCIESVKISGIIELIPTYKSILVIYNPLEISYENLISKLKSVEKSVKEIKLPAAEIIHIPTLYGGEYGLDLDYVAEYNNLTVEEVIKIHNGRDYLIYMLGFTPGFPYLGGMSEKIYTPRLESPRVKIMNGTVGIAGKQTGIYPIDSPGGWQLIGRTPVKIFDINREPAALLSSGQYIRFEAVDFDEYTEILQRIESGQYEVKRSLVKEVSIHE